MTTVRAARSLLVGMWACTCCLGMPGATAADWPTYRGDSCRSGVSSETLQLPLREVWAHRARHAPRPAWPGPAKADFAHGLHGLSPTMIYDRAYHTVVVGDAVYYGSSADDTVYCLEAATGRPRWSFTTEGPVRLAPTIAGGKAYIGSDDGCVYCLDAVKGDLLWSCRISPEDRRLPGNGRMVSLWPVRTGVVVDGDVAYCAAGLFPSQDVYLCALDAEDGKEIWKQRIGVSAQGYMLASPTRLFIPTGRTAPRAFDRRDGKTLRSLASLGGSFALVLDDMLVHGGDERGSINIDDPSSGERIVSVRAQRLVAKGPMVYFLRDETLTALDRTAYLRLSKEIRAIEKVRKGQRTAEQTERLVELRQQREACQKWEAPCEAPYELIATENVVLAGGRDQVVGYDATSGDVAWTASVDGKAYGIAVSNGRLFVSTDQGAVHCFAPAAARAPEMPVTEAPRGSETSPYHEDEWTAAYRRAADTIVARSGIKQGYCLVLDAGIGRLAHELAKRTDLRIIGVEANPGKVATARELLRGTGLYGTRIAAHQLASGDLPFPKYFANLVVSDRAVVTGEPPAVSADRLWRFVRPCGGALFATGGKTDALREWGAGVLPEWRVARDERGCWAMARRGALPGSGEWTHAYAEPGNTASSRDELVWGGMDLQWFGRPGPRRMIDRHHRNVPPLYKDGRCFIPGDCVVYVVDAYNGTILWSVEVPDSRRLGVFLDSSNLAVDGECLYLVAKDKCHGFDVETGRKRLERALPQLVEGERRNWGYVAYSGDLLFGSGCRPDASYTETSRAAEAELWHRNMKLVTSDYLFGMDRESGELLWTYRSGLVVNTTITLGGGRMYFVESHSPKALANEKGRMPLATLFDGGEQHLVAMDMPTGQVVYKRKLDVSELQQVCYLAYADGILLLSGSKETGKTVHYHYYAFDAENGEERWKADHNSGLPSDGGHGEYNRHPTIVGDTVYAWPYAYKLKTGARIDDWRFSRLGHGCGGISASACSLFWRGGNPWMYDLKPQGGPLRLTRITRPGCWINIIPAGGLALVPEASSGCTCAFSIQASMAFRPAPPIPKAMPDQSLFLDSVRIELSDRSGKGKVYYTLDGSEPTADCPTYAGPLVCNETTRVMARTFWEDGSHSRVVDRTYTRVEARTAERVVGLEPGLRYRYYEGRRVARISELDNWELVAEGAAEAVSLAPARRREDFALRFTGYIRVPRDGVYTFYTSSDDGSRLDIGSDTVVNNDGLHGAATRQGQVALEAGLHPLAVVFFQAGGGVVLEAGWEGPELPRQPLPADVLFHRP